MHLGRVTGDRSKFTLCIFGVVLYATSLLICVYSIGMGSRVGGASWRLKICLVGKLLKHVSFACVVPRFDVSDTVISDLNRVPWP